LTTAYPGINYQTPTFYAGPYTGISPNLLGYTAGQPQVNIAGKPQVNTTSQRNTSEITNSGLSNRIKLMMANEDVGFASQNNIFFELPQ